MRRDFATNSGFADSSVTTTGPRAILVAGSLGSGAALIADIVDDVVRLALGRVERRRQAIGLGPRSLTVERVDIDPTAVDRHCREAAGLAILCDQQAEAAFSESSFTADEQIVVDQDIPAWRQNMLPAVPDAESTRLRSIDTAAHAAAILSRRLPYAGDLWRRSLARHVPKRYREAALAKFDELSS